MKKIAFIFVLALLVNVLAGCAGTAVVYYSDCTCPTDVQVEQTQTGSASESKEDASAPEGALKTGLAIVAGASKSVSAEGDTPGKAEFDVTIAAVLVDKDGVIVDCLIDSIGTSVAFDARGQIDTSALPEVLTKNELGEAYGMKRSGSAYEWNEQAAALCEYAIGKTVEELRNGAVNESGKAADADLASKASIYLGGYVGAIEEAVKNAAYLGAQTGDELRMAAISSLSDSKSSDGENGGTAQLNIDVTAISMSGDIITSCVLDSIQAKVGFDSSGILGELGQMLTKNQLGEAYGMKKYGSAYEWNEQAAAFAAYVTGKTADEVIHIVVDERTAPTDVDLSSTVTIAVGGFQALIVKAAA